jgi:hypothetical protein
VLFGVEHGREDVRPPEGRSLFVGDLHGFHRGVHDAERLLGHSDARSAGTEVIGDMCVLSF